MKRIPIARPIAVVNFSRMSKDSSTGDARYLVGLEDDLADLHAGLPKDTNNVVLNLPQLETLAKSNNMSVNAAFHLLRLAGNTVTVTVEERVHGEEIMDADGNPVLDASGQPRTYEGRYDGSTKPGDTYATISIDYLEFGQPALAEYTKAVITAELDMMKKNNENYVFPVRKATGRRLGADSDGNVHSDSNTENSSATEFKFRVRKANETASAYNAEKAKAKEEFEANLAGG